MAEKLIVRGDRPLEGEIEICGSKNAATKAMIASLLTEEPCTIENIPLSQDIAITKELCERIGSEVVCDNDHRCILAAPEIRTTSVIELSRRNRIPILTMGPLLHRRGEAEVPFLGGDPIGHRPIDFHLTALTQMGVRIERREHSYYATARHIRGADIELPFPSVGATENVILTAVLAQGKTRLTNAAIEPEIANLIGMLTAMGAAIRCDSSSRFMEITGVSRLRGVTHRVIPDRIETVSFATAALATGGNVLVRGVLTADIERFIDMIRAMEGRVEVLPDGVRFSSTPSYRPTVIEAAPHPGFLTDWQPPVSILLTKANGASIIHETVHEDRFGYVKDLRRMGAEIAISDECLGGPPCRFVNRTFNHSARIMGPTRLRGADLKMTDIRAGMAHVIAALAAEGESVISGVEHIDRGYEKIDERLRALGADIRRV